MTPRPALRRAGALALPLALLLAGCATTDDLGRGRGGPRPGEAAAVDALVLAAAPQGAVLPFGTMATACGTPDAALGRAIEAAGPYVIHDTAPGSTAPRTHYVTGFADGCPRQVTAALAMFGDPATHEMLRYGPSPGPYGAVDRAYEAIKAQVCRVASGQPCGARIEALAADTTFLTVYPVFGGEEHVDLLFHGGEVVAVDPPA